MKLQQVACTHPRHAGAILAIFNEAIENATALRDYEPRPTQAMKAWFDAKPRVVRVGRGELARLGLAAR